MTCSRSCSSSLLTGMWERSCGSEVIKLTARGRIPQGRAKAIARWCCARAWRLSGHGREPVHDDGLAQAVTELPATTRDGIGTGGPVPLRAPRALTGDERARLEARLAEALGRKVALAVETDPALIAGLELDAPHAIVRNHFRADLDRIKAEVLAHD